MGALRVMSARGMGRYGPSALSPHSLYFLFFILKSVSAIPPGLTASSCYLGGIAANIKTRALKAEVEKGSVQQ